MSDVLTYSLSGDDDDVPGGFEIDPATGQITVGPRTVLDAEATGGESYTVTVTVTEAGGRATPSTPPAVTITVNDVNEAPMVTMGLTMLEESGGQRKQY